RQVLVPCVRNACRVMGHSVALNEYLDETWPYRRLMPATARDRQRVRSIAQMIACDVHPLNNLRVLQYLENTLGADQQARDAWVRHGISLGLAAVEQSLGDNPSTGTFCDGEIPTLADICLGPQVYNA